MKHCHLCTEVCRKLRKPARIDPAGAQQRTCLVIRSIADLLMLDGLICLDFQDIQSVLQDSGTATVGIGEAAGEGRATRAAEAAILDLNRQLAAK
jgi:cell division GTPase FtsZ